MSWFHLFGQPKQRETIAEPSKPKSYGIEIDGENEVRLGFEETGANEEESIQVERIYNETDRDEIKNGSPIENSYITYQVTIIEFFLKKSQSKVKNVHPF